MLRTFSASVMRWKRRMRSCRKSSRRRVQAWNHQAHHRDDLSTTRCHLRQEQHPEELKFRLGNHRWIQQTFQNFHHGSLTHLQLMSTRVVETGFDGLEDFWTPVDQQPQTNNSIVLNLEQIALHGWREKSG